MKFRRLGGISQTETLHLYLRLYFMDDEIVFGYQIRFYYESGVNFQSDYDKVKALVEERCTKSDSPNPVYTMEDGAVVRFALFDSEKTALSDTTSGINFQLWKQP